MEFKNINFYDCCFMDLTELAYKRSKYLVSYLNLKRIKEKTFLKDVDLQSFLIQ